MVIFQDRPMFSHIIEKVSARASIDLAEHREIYQDTYFHPFRLTSKTDVLAFLKSGVFFLLCTTRQTKLTNKKNHQRLIALHIEYELERTRTDQFQNGIDQVSYIRSRVSRVFSRRSIRQHCRARSGLQRRPQVLPPVDNVA